MKAKPTAKELHDYCQRLGITAKTAGKSLNKLIEEAHASDDPKAFLDLYAPSISSAGEATAVEEEPPAEALAAPAPAAVATAEAESNSLTAILEVPYVGEIPPGVYVPDSLHLEVRLRKPAIARAFKQLSVALLEKNVKLANGRPVYSSANVVEWLVEQLAAAMDGAIS